MDRLQFVKTIAELAVKYPSSFFNSVTIAQACLESGYGTSELYKKANNAFGYKAKDNEWNGSTHSVYTKEEINGKVITVHARFRKYGSIEESVADHATMMTRTASYAEIYKKAINAKTPQEQAQALVGTYATDSGYARKLIEIINKYDLTQYDRGKDMLGLTIKKQLLPLTKTFGRVSHKRGITLHQTGAPQSWANAQGLANYQKQMSDPRNKEEKSWHYQVDDKEAIQSFDHNVGCWHASDGSGEGNMHTIGIESCINAGSDYAKTIDNTCKLMAIICHQEGFNPYTQIKRHYDYARDKKWCPAQIMNGKGGFTFKWVLDKTAEYLGQLKGGNFNPQGLDMLDISAYESPRLPFRKLAVGDTVTIMDGFYWYDYSNKKQLLSKRQGEIQGTQDVIVEVKDIEDVGNSEYAYKLKKYNSWILEQYLEEPRSDWEVIDVDDDDDKNDDELQEGQFWLDGVLYQVSKV